MLSKNDGINRLARVLQKRVNDTMEQSNPIIDFGMINSDMSLTADLFPVPIPQSDYMVCRSRTITKNTMTTTSTSSEHLHNVITPTELQSIKAGDRVLIVWNGNEAVVIDVIVSANNLKE